jgi:tetratricopeptide (TPR) repeat protein
LGTLWEVRMPLFVGRDLLVQALARAADAPKTARAKALYWAGRISLRQGLLRPAHGELTACLELYRELEDRRGISLALNDLGSVAHWRGHFTASLAFLTESLHLREEMGEPWWLAQTLTNLGLASYRGGNYTQASHYYTEALRYFQATGAQMPQAWPIGGLGTVALAQGNHGEARQLLEESADIWRKNRFQWALAYRLNDLGLLWWSIRNLDEAEQVHRESLSICQEIGDRRGMFFAVEGLARVAALQAKVKRAGRLFGAAKSLANIVDTELAVLEEIARAQAIDSLSAHFHEISSAIRWAEGLELSVDEIIAFGLSDF